MVFEWFVTKNKGGGGGFHLPRPLASHKHPALSRVKGWMGSLLTCFSKFIPHPPYFPIYNFFIATKFHHVMILGQIPETERVPQMA